MFFDRRGRAEIYFRPAKMAGRIFETVNGEDVWTLETMV